MQCHNLLNGFLGQASLGPISERTVAILLDASVKGSCILLAAAVAALLMRRGPAAWRHLLWLAAMSSLVALPVLAALLPSLRLRILPRASEAAAIAAMMETPIAQMPAVPHTSAVRSTAEPTVPPREPSRSQGKSTLRNDGRSAPPPEARESTAAPRAATTWTPPAARPVRAAAEPAQPQPMRWPIWIAITWLVGLCIALIPLLIGLGVVRRRARTAIPAGEAWTALLVQASDRLGLRRPTVLVRARCAVPMTYGVRRPVVLLPNDADTWPADRKWSVLLHELAHVRRFDCLTQILAHVICAGYWFNPFVWLGARRLRVEREAACDDVVLRLGEKPSNYAAHLLEVARSAAGVSGGHAELLAAVAMARPCRKRQLEQRVRAILDAGKQRGAVTRRVGVAVLALVAMLAVPLASVRLAARAQDRPRSTAPEKPAAATRPAGPTTSPAIADGEKLATAAPTTAAATHPAAVDRFMDFRVVAKTTGEPLAAELTVNLNYKLSTVVLGADGRHRLTYPSDAKYLTVTASKGGFVPTWVEWPTQPTTDAVPATYTLAIETGTGIGGLVIDEAGKPIPGATVSVLIDRKSDSREHPATQDFPSKTDVNGRWRSDLIPKDASNLSLRLTHEDYLSDEMYGVTPTPPLAELRRFGGVMVMKKGVAVTGRVVAPDGTPVARAAIVQGDEPYNFYPRTKTDADGRFVFKQSRLGKMVLNVRAAGWAPELRRIVVAAGIAPVDFRLEPSKTLRGRVVDAAGKPVAGAMVGAESWRDCHSLTWKTTTDDDGRFVWTGAPSDAVFYYALKEGYRDVRGWKVTASDKEQSVTMTSPLIVRGRVMDAQSGAPVNGFRVLRGVDSGNGRIAWLRDERPVVGNNGAFEMQETDPRDKSALRIEAAGYLPAESRVFRGDQQQDLFEFKLKKAADVAGVARTPDGQPLAAAQVILCNKQSSAFIRDGRLSLQTHDEQVMQSGPDGRFSFPSQSGPFTIAILHDYGYAEIPGEQLADSSNVLVQPWGKVHGVLRIGAKAGAYQTMSVFPLHSGEEAGQRPRPMHEMLAHTDDQGRFSFDRVPAGDVSVSLQVKSGRITTVTQSNRVRVGAGQDLEVNIGGLGRAVTGRVMVPPDLAGKVDWSREFGWITTKIEIRRPAYPPGWDAKAPAEKAQWLDTWRKSDEGIAWEKARQQASVSQHSYSMKVEPDGSFRVEDILPGTYELHISTIPTDAREGTPTRASVSQEFAVPDIPGGRVDEPLELPAMMLTPAPPAPARSATQPGGARSDAAPEPPPVQDPWLHVHGTVTDTATGRPIDQFTVIRGMAAANELPRFFDRPQPKEITHGGKFDLHLIVPRIEYVIRVEAEGYLRADSRRLKYDENDVVLDFKLIKCPDVIGVVRTRDGKPLSGAQVLLGQAGDQAIIHDGKLDVGHRSFRQTRTDVDGRFQFSPPGAPYKLVVLHESAYAEATSQQMAHSAEIIAQPWGKLRGIAKVGSKPAAGKRIDIYSQGMTFWDDEEEDEVVSSIGHNMQLTADGEGRFSADHIPPTDLVAGLEVGSDEGFLGTVQPTRFTVAPGQTAELTIGGKGRPVVGRFVIPPVVAGRIDWSKICADLNRPFPWPKPSLPSNWNTMAEEQRAAWKDGWLKTNDGRAHVAARWKWIDEVNQVSVRVLPDGSFRAEDLVPGKYHINFEPNAKSSKEIPDNVDDPIASGEADFLVPEMPGGRSDDALIVPPITVNAIPHLEVGDPATELTIKTLGGGDLPLSRLRGKFVLLNFWAPSLERSVLQLRWLREVYGNFGGDEKFTMINVDLSDRVEDLKTFVAKQDMKWTQGYFAGEAVKGTFQAYCRRGIPSAWLIGPDGKVIAKDLIGDAIGPAVAKALAGARAASP